MRTELAFWPRMRTDRVVDLYDYGWDHGYYYLLMRFMANGSLEHLLETRNTAGITLPKFALAFAEALREVHGACGAHGCLKPSNVFLDNPKHVRLSDFAIPLWFDEADHEDSPLRSRVLHAYRAPEQHANPRDYSTRSDVYSYGLIMLRCLSGEAPTLTGKPPEGYTTDWPAGLAEVMPRCLSDDPLDRYSDGYELYEELREALESEEARRYYGEHSAEDIAGGDAEAAEDMEATASEDSTEAGQEFELPEAEMEDEGAEEPDAEPTGEGLELGEGPRPPAEQFAEAMRNQRSYSPRHANASTRATSRKLWACWRPCPRENPRCSPCWTR
jgi:serine/threonine protein kinase